MHRHHLLLVALLAACGGGDATKPVDRGSICADVADVRACWDCAKDFPACVVAYNVPAKRHGGPFLCDKNGECTQRHPRMPDDGEWECIEIAGGVRCHGGEPPSAVVVGPPEPGWICGERKQGPRGPEKVCVDFQPDLPPGEGPWTCRYDHQHGEKRICRHGSTGAMLGTDCEDTPMPEGADCAYMHWIPPKPAPNCWFDTDCTEGQKCNFGTCS